jgi:amino-acid N-acetyltransferase
MRGFSSAYQPAPSLSCRLEKRSGAGKKTHQGSAIGASKAGRRAITPTWQVAGRPLFLLRACTFSSERESESPKNKPFTPAGNQQGPLGHDGVASGYNVSESSPPERAMEKEPLAFSANNPLTSTAGQGSTLSWTKRLSNLASASITNAMPVEEPISVSAGHAAVMPDDHHSPSVDTAIDSTQQERHGTDSDPYEWPIANFDASNLSWISAAEMTEWNRIERARQASAPNATTTTAPDTDKTKAENTPLSNPSNGTSFAANGTAFVSFLRNCSPYIYAHRNKTFVIHIPGQMLLNRPLFDALMQDVALIKSLGVRVVLVGGCRPQIDRCLERHGVEQRFVQGIRISSPEVMQAVLEASGYVRFAIESALQRRPSNSVSLRTPNVVSGNFFTAQPIGVVEGTDFGYTGKVRKIDVSKIEKRLDEDEIVILSNVGFAPSGALFNCQSEEVASSCASQLHADKLIFMTEGEMLVDLRTRTIMHNIPLRAAMEFLYLDAQRRHPPSPLPNAVAAPEAVDDSRRMPALFHLYLQEGVRALQGGVTRAHLINMFVDGAILIELFTRDGVGLMISRDIYEGIRSAKIADIPGIMDLIRPLENEGILVPRSREALESEIHRFLVVVRDGMVTACAALVPFESGEVAEIACFVVSPQYRGRGKGDALLGFLERRALSRGIRRVFILSVRAFHWFLERGFREGTVEDLPREKRDKYNFHRRSKIYIKDLSSQREVDEEELLRGL